MGAIAGWTLEEELSRGGFGAVWRARDAQGRPGALKLLALTGDPAELARFQREVEALRRLRHPGVVGILDAGVDQGRPWLVMELIEGESLEQRLRQAGPCAPAEAVRLTGELCEALVAVHGLGLVHRDVKPANVIQARSTGRAVLVDFGLSRDMFDSGRLTRTGEALGTPAYMAPEQVMGERNLGPAVDVWAVAATLHALLTGVPPFGAGPVTAVLQRILQSDPAPPSRAAPGVTPALDALVLRCLAKRPAERPPTAAALLAALGDPALLRVTATRSLSAPLMALSLLLAGAGSAGWLLLRAPASEPPPVAPPVAPPEAPSRQRLVLQPGPREGQDTYITNYGLRVNDNYGATGGLFLGETQSELNRQAGHNRVLVRFDLRRLPTGAQVESATLELFLCKGPPEALRVRARRIAARWAEGSTTCDGELDGVAWAGRFLETPLPEARSDLPAFDQPALLDEDVCQIEIAPGATGAVRLDVTSAVRAWYERPLENHGLCLSRVEESPDRRGPAALLFSSDHWQADTRPRLTIEYQGPPAHEATPPARDRAEAERLLAQLDSMPCDRLSLHIASQACAAAPEWATPFLVRTWIALRREDRPGSGGLDPEAACEALRTALAREVHEDELPRLRRLAEEIVAAALEVVDRATGRKGSTRLIALAGSHVRGACPRVRDDPALRALFARYERE